MQFLQQSNNMQVNTGRASTLKKMCGNAWVYDVDCDPKPRKSKKNKKKNKKKRTACFDRKVDWSLNKENKKRLTSKARELTPEECAVVEARNLKAGTIVGRAPLQHPVAAYRE